ncbi:MAG: hypothetical protein JWP29_1478 [Rhodoferax sp.]|nr:hypothetical protein [Rhodoferax sp.]
MAQTGASLTASPLWARLRRWALPALGIFVLGLLLSHAHKVDWGGAWDALKQYPPLLLLGVLALATASHALYGCFDLIGRRHTGHPLRWWHAWAIAVTSYAFNLNLGSLVGGVAMRARLYARAGLDEATVAQVVGISLATNWLGYCLLAGGLFAAGVIAPPDQAPISPFALRAIGVGMVALAAGYVVLCAVGRERSWKVRGKTLHLPSPPLAVVQLMLSAANWALMGAAMYLLLSGKVPYGVVLGVLLAASIVGVLTPIPAGLGVLEAVYIALLAGMVGQGKLMGAVLAYRALYYLLPLAGGLLLYAALERYHAAHAVEDVEGLVGGAGDGMASGRPVAGSVFKSG